MADQQVMRPLRIPTDKVIEMRNQGVSNNQIIQILQRDGFELTAIFNAMNQADIKGGIDAGAFSETMPEDANQQSFPEQGGSTMPQQPIQQMNYNQQVPMMQDTGMMTDQDMGMQPGMDQMQQQMDSGSAQMPPMDYNQQGYATAPAYGAPGYGPSLETQRIEELAEAIIDEKWNEIVRSINKIIDWKERVEARVTKMEQQLDDMNKNFETLHKGVLGKITDYDRNLTNVGAEIKAMDKVFQKVLPTLTESVGELSRITSSMRKK